MKKGCVLKNTETGAKVSNLNVSWYYTWGTKQIVGAPAIEFVPMIWGKNVVRDVVWDTVLILNEPDRADQSNVAVEDALTRWNSIQAVRKGSPATAGNALTSQWFNAFMLHAKPDFICIHWYGPPNPDSLLKLVDGLYAKYSIPIWITEFAVAQWDTTKPSYTVDQVLEFMKIVIPRLEARAHVERYAWKTREQSDLNMGSSALFDDAGNLTQVGQLYASL